ncbi:unnamed protein product [Phytophthora lilii]|uniref:Unnamed protein product n=1 Tax=Phytophthora lilii TaxID=2077276 RepID=A0A9W6TK07_9STRA|nr:unnamed protein product [Phytophthora lilii]
MFQQFCSGSDALLQDFVGRGNEVISLIPADIQATSMSSAARARHAAELASQMPLRSTLDLSPGELERDLDSESEDEEDIDEDDDEIKTIVELASVASVPPSLDELRVCIIDVLQRVEEREPWYQVFNPDRLPLPFSVVKRPLLAAALKDFWAKNARAVWERQFWAPLVNMEDQRIYRARKQRQSKARAAFERVMIRVHTELGANFFVQLDQRAKPHKGWWYVEPVQDLVQLAQREGLATCLCYVESQALERFPVVPGGDVRNAKPENSKSKSMWTVKCAMQPILEEVCAIKAKNKRLGRRKQK